MLTLTAYDSKPEQASRSSCGFCEAGHGQAPGTCRDTGGHCHGTWPHFVRATRDNPDGSWTCACAEAGHPGRTHHA